MKLIITADFDAYSKLEKILLDFNAQEFRDYFEDKDYGPAILSIGIVLVCRDTTLNFKRRIRFSKKDKCLYIDVILDPRQLSWKTETARKKIVLDKITSDIPPVLEKYEGVVRQHGLGEFNASRFVQDLKAWGQCISTGRR